MFYHIGALTHVRRSLYQKQLSFNDIDYWNYQNIQNTRLVRIQDQFDIFSRKSRIFNHSSFPEKYLPPLPLLLILLHPVDLQPLLTCLLVRAKHSLPFQGCFESVTFHYGSFYHAEEIGATRQMLYGSKTGIIMGKHLSENVGPSLVRIVLQYVVTYPNRF